MLFIWLNVNVVTCNTLVKQINKFPNVWIAIDFISIITRIKAMRLMLLCISTQIHIHLTISDLFLSILSIMRWIVFQLIRFARVSSHVVDFNARNKSLTAKLLQQGYRYHKLRKTFSKFYRRHYELVSKFNVGLKTLLHQGLSEPEFYGDLVYKFKKIVGRVDFSDQFRKIIVRYKRIGYNINIMRQSACLVFKPITVNNFASLFNCTPVGRESDSMMAPT